MKGNTLYCASFFAGVGGIDTGFGQAGFRTVYANEITEILYQHYGNNIHIFEKVIPMSVRAAEAAAEGVSIYTHDPKGKVASAYEIITKEVAEHE